MRTSPNRPSRAKSAARAANPAPTRPAPQPAGASLEWSDPAAVRAWLRDVRTQSRDVVAAGLDATAPLGERELGRRAARRIIVDAEGALETLFASAAAGLSGEEGDAAAQDASTPSAAARADRGRR